MEYFKFVTIEAYFSKSSQVSFMLKNLEQILFLCTKKMEFDDEEFKFESQFKQKLRFQ